jgi:serine/threonine protein phosphatase PrpC
MNYTFCSQTHMGRVRNNNEDAVAFDEATKLAVLADGMGGYSAGEIASGMATALLQSAAGCPRRVSQPASRMSGAPSRLVLTMPIARSSMPRAPTRNMREWEQPW